MTFSITIITLKKLALVYSIISQMGYLSGTTATINLIHIKMRKFRQIPEMRGKKIGCQ